ncbi:ABC-2 type transport system ATP-binding protein [Cerasibacillus quisquiliarum]|uniref:ABC transporter domain-containing protein n=1 Tax=Cerasibacillus quisquiliarum TaxID=227865 RepID=A0A511UU21_9BACI|nr:ABC transporter ATP-binding protein [Cerasibacillus quisquiliarum]MBB5145034.1 ABC-2 type transport system ATP-binding protein [Cerasibacillus quisquiliarum]GEN30074.1 hypothetical protein CQU01_03120 [Cerasibacillus quisquiliarum]
MLQVEALHKSYGNHVILEDITFTLEKGDIVGLVGENGAGKSTLLHILATLQKPSKGKLTLNGMTYHWKSLSHIRRQIGFVPQEIAIWDHLTVEENMVFFEKLSWKNKSKEELQNLCLDMKLNRWKEPVHTLSGGMKRKLNLAISLIHEPKLLLLDEPTVGIDLKSKQEIASYLKDLATKRGVAMIYISHDMNEIMNLCDQVFCIGDDSFYDRLLTQAGQEVIRL